MNEIRVLAYTCLAAPIPMVGGWVAAWLSGEDMDWIYGLAASASGVLYMALFRLLPFGNVTLGEIRELFKKPQTKYQRFFAQMYPLDMMAMIFALGVYFSK